MFELRTWRRRAAVVTAAVAIAVPATTASADTNAKLRSGTSLAGPAAVTYGGKLNLQGIVGRAGTAIRISGARVILQRATPGRTNWSSVTSRVTNAEGRYSFYPVSVGRPFAYRVVWPGNAAYMGSVSPVRTPAVRPYVGIQYIADDYPLGDGDDLNAELKVFPKRTGRPAFLQRYDAKSNSFRNIGFGRQQSARFAIWASLAGSTGYFRVYAPAVDGYAAGYSAVRRFVHYSERGGFKRPVRATGGTNHPVISVFPPAKDPYRARAGAWAGKGGSAWVDLDITGCKWVQPLPDGLDTTGGRTRFEALIDGEVRYQSELSHSGTEYIFPFPELYVGGERTLRLRISDIDTDSGPRAILKVYSHCAS